MKMEMRPHPFEKLTQARFRFWFWLLCAATLTLLVVLSILGAPLQRSRTANGGACDIVSFELAGTVERAGAIVDAWQGGGVLASAKWNTWLDYLFLACYPNLAALAICGILRRPMSKSLARLGRGLAWAQWLVMASDAVENVGLLHTIYSGANWPWPQVAFGCACVKFGLLLAGLLYLPAALLRTRRGG